ncbi:late histone H2B.L4-like [Bubalus kerabau]|uniref:late histone H2B.L4-like n=1 Tax=Bubalus carabanensis TaxID=3119969 RepID=UPI00244E68BF|nr:late histone H2B.L4-like [Bubalus carabanensis]
MMQNQNRQSRRQLIAAIAVAGTAVRTISQVLLPISPGCLRQIHKGLSLSHDSVNILDSFVKDMFERIAEEAGCLARYNKRRTISHQDIETAVRLLLPGELRKHAITEATKSLIRYHTCR